MADNLAPSKIAPIVLAMLIVFADPAVAAYDAAVAAFEAGAYDEAIRDFERLARQGDDRARYYLGLMHKDGLGGAADPAGALAWFLCAAAKTGEFAAQTAQWRDRLVAKMKPSVVAAAEQEAVRCRTGAVVGRRSGTASSWSYAERRPDQNFSVLPTSPAEQRPAVRRDGHASPHRPLWFRIFYFPAHASLNGFEFLAESADLHALKRDLGLATGGKDSVVMGLFALVWWIMIFRTVLLFCRSVRTTESQAPPDGQRVKIGGAASWRRQ